MMHQLICRFALLILLLSGSSAAPAQSPSGYVDVQVVNPYGQDLEVELYDHVCERSVLAKRIDGDGSIPVQLCSTGLGRGDATVTNRLSGAEMRYREVLDGTRLEVPD